MLKWGGVIARLPSSHLQTEELEKLSLSTSAATHLWDVSRVAWPSLSSLLTAESQAWPFTERAPPSQPDGTPSPLSFKQFNDLLRFDFEAVSREQFNDLPRSTLPLPVHFFLVGFVFFHSSSHHRIEWKKYSFWTLPFVSQRPTLG